jgi:2-dehydro-3-deoxyphosphogluconate aldolase/(4S)-4-hydroxy-2-oxoglutarate aldolase
MSRPGLPPRLSGSGVVAILRGGTGEHLEAVACALVEAGIACLEITTNTPGHAEVLPRLRQRYGDDVELGLGTVRRPEHVQRAKELGATFVVAPDTNVEIGRAAARAGLAWMPGAFTPTEIGQAWDLGATAVKVFPAEQAGGPDYLAAVRAPLDDVALLPTGGVGPDNAAAYMRAGAVAVGAGSPLIGRSLTTGDVAGLADRAGALLAAVAGGRPA